MTYERTPCPICSGSKTIRLPVRRPVSAVRIAEPSSRINDDSIRTFPCPECTTVQDHKLHIVGAAGSMHDDDLARHPEAREATQRTAVHSIVEYLLRHDLVQFNEQPDPTGRAGLTEIVAKLAVVTPDRITPLEQRVREAVAPAVAEVVDRAIEKIRVWGSAYGCEAVSKDEAVRFIHEAAREATE